MDFHKIKLLAFSLAFLLCTSVAHTDTLLVGYDVEDSTFDSCFALANTIDGGTWKANRYTSKASGTIGYFKLEVGETPTGCTNDAGCWAIYEGGSDTVPGALKAYTCFTGYNWTTTGIGVHTWSVETTVTDLMVTSGQYYWIVFYSTGSDATQYAGAGCSAQIRSYRGDGDSTCTDEGPLFYIPPNVAGRAVAEYYDYPPPPANTSLSSGVATYIRWGVWTDSTPAEVPRGVTGVGVVSGGSIR